MFRMFFLRIRDFQRNRIHAEVIKHRLIAVEQMIWQRGKVFATDSGNQKRPAKDVIRVAPAVAQQAIGRQMPVVSFNALLYSQRLLNGILSRKSRIGIAIRDSVRNIYMPYTPLWIDLSVGGVTVYSQHVPAYNPSSSMLSQALGH